MRQSDVSLFRLCLKNRLPQGTQDLVSPLFILLLVILTSITATENDVDFDSIIADYLPRIVATPKASTPSQIGPNPSIDYLDGLY